MLRTICRCCVLVLGAAAALRLAPWAWAAMGLPALSPFVAISSAVAMRAAGIGLLLGLPALALALAVDRGICRYACPMGLLLEWVSRLRPRARPRRLPPLGHWALLLTLGGAAAGYPLLIWLDPFALFHGFVGALRPPVTALALLSAVGVPALGLFSLILPRAWCGRVCPLGAMQELLTTARRTLGSEEPSPAPAAEPSVLRRSVLAMGLGAAWAMATLRRPRAAGARPVRPPGALDEARFPGACVRCGNCMRACPTRILRPDTASVAGFLAPVAEFSGGYCREDCAACGEVCPSGAIARLPIGRKRATPMGIAKVDMGLCALTHGRECSACILRCPYEAITTAFNEEDYTTTLRVDAGRCPGCGACELACPMPIKAIVVHPV